MSKETTLNDAPSIEAAIDTSAHDADMTELVERHQRNATSGDSRLEQIARDFLLILKHITK